MKTLILTIGLPRSGKSTWSKEQGYPIVNRDSIRYAIGGSIRYFHAEDRVNEIEKIMVKSLFKAGHDTVIIDATHLKQKYIDAWEDYAVNPIWSPYQNEVRYPHRMDCNFQITLQKFYTPVTTCMERARKDFPEDKKFASIIKNMWESADTIEIPAGVPLNQTLGYMKAIRGEL